MSNLREATVDDLDALAGLESRSFGAASWSRDLVAAELDSVGETRWVVVADDGAGTVVGYAVLRYAGGVGDVHRIAVDPEHQRRGHATAMVRRLIELALAERCERVLLEVAATNAAALALYARHGFVEVARRRRYYAGEVDAVVLQRHLAAP